MTTILRALDWIGRLQILKSIYDSVDKKLHLSEKRNELWEKTVKEYKDKGYSQKEAELEALNDLGYLDFDEYNGIKNAM